MVYTTLESTIGLISEIQCLHNESSIKWLEYCKNNDILVYNQDSKYVRDIEKETQIYESILRYRTFAEASIIDLGEVRCRVKALNSIENKINEYAHHKKEEGKTAVNKCLNDIVGVRIITEDFYSKEEIEAFIKANFKKVKCTLSRRKGYEATHIYFKYDNCTYQWELQVWCKGKEESNSNSHSMYKQQYTSWEQQIKQEEE